MSFRPTKRRRHGTLHAALAAAIAQIGSMDAAADVIGRKRAWLYTAADPDADENREAKLTYEHARRMSEAGATALAEDLALLAGGVFLPPPPTNAPAALQAALATYSVESGQVLAEIIQRAADGVFDQGDGEAALKEVDDALRALMAVRSVVAAAAEGAR